MKAPDGTVLVRKDRKFTSAGVRKMREAGIEWLSIPVEDLVRTDAVKRVAPVDIVDETTGEVILESNETLDQETLDELHARGINEFPLLYLDPLITGTALRDTLLADKTLTQEDAIIEIYRRLRPGRSAHGRDGDQPVPESVLQPGALRPLEGRPAQGQPQAQLQPRGPRALAAARARHARGGDPARASSRRCGPTTSSRR